MVAPLSEFVIRDEACDDAAAVFDVESAAFGHRDEARIVNAIRGTAHAVGSFVGVEKARIVAHVSSRVSASTAPRMRS